MGWHKEYKTEHIMVLGTHLSLTPRGECYYYNESSMNHRTVQADVQTMQHAIQQLELAIEMFESAPERK